MTVYHLLFAPFADYGFLRRALIACVALGIGSGPVGVLLMLRRMSLVGDAMSHAILPGAAVGFLIAVNRRSNLTPYRRPILTPLSDGFWR